MTTKFIGLKELRQNMAKVSGIALKKHQRLIVLKKNKPIFELRPLLDEEAMIESLMAEIESAKQDVRKGKLYSAQQVRKKLGLL